MTQSTDTCHLLTSISFPQVDSFLSLKLCSRFFRPYGISEEDLFQSSKFLEAVKKFNFQNIQKEDFP
ncbi:hypothetical protein Pfo_010397 [Paulownia fortunei]|nr:hypothetical protein Pfo_010397 [Paulownia fortunei]